MYARILFSRPRDKEFSTIISALKLVCLHGRFTSVYVTSIDLFYFSDCILITVKSVLQGSR